MCHPAPADVLFSHHCRLATPRTNGKSTLSTLDNPHPNNTQNNQVAALTKAKINAATINSTTPYSTKQVIFQDLKSGHPRIRLLYVTPEMCAADSFRRLLHTIHDQGELARIAIDEAHCISEWGHDFRRSFQDLSFFKSAFADVPIICLTATATPKVRTDIIRTLALNPQNLKLFTMTTSRPNLHYEIRFKSDDGDQYDDFLAWLRGVHARRAATARSAELGPAERADNVSGIIYTTRRLDCEALAARLVEDGIGAKSFHAGMPAEARDDVLHGWVADKPGYDVVVATTAFGMGIDKDNVRFVVHWCIPKSFEGYYQEAGRAGRDGRASVAVMYYGREDRDRAAAMVTSGNGGGGGGARRGSDGGEAAQLAGRTASLRALAEYCESTSGCRHAAIARYFGEDEAPPCDYACDWHKDPAALRRRKDRGLASEEWCSTQRESGAWAVGEEYE